MQALKMLPGCVQADGPIGLIVAPTRELVQQIGKDIKRFSKALAITCTSVYGGSGVSNQVMLPGLLRFWNKNSSSVKD